MRLVDLGNDWIANALQILHLGLIVFFVGIIVGVEPVFCFGEGLSNCVLVLLFQLVGQLILVLDSVAHLEDVVLESVLSVNLLLDKFIFLGELLGVKDHLLDFFLCETAFVVGDGDVLLFAGSLLNTADSQDGVLVDFESNFDLRNTSLRGRNASQIKLTELMVVLD